MIKNSYSITMKSFSTCPAKTKALAVVEEAQKNKVAAPFKAVLSTELFMDKLSVYMDSIQDENLFGVVAEVKNDKEMLDEDDLKAIIEQENYEILIKETDGKKTFSGELNLLVNEGAAVQTSDDALKEEVNQWVKKVVEAGYVTKEEMDARMKVFRANYFDDYLILRTLKQYRNYNKPCHVPSCIYQDPYLADRRKNKQEGILAEGVRMGVSRTAIIGEGEKSVGKNVFAETVAWLLNMPMYLITFSRQMSPSSVFGEKTTDNSAAKELASFDSDILAKADVVHEKIRFGMNLYARTGIGNDEAMKNIMDGLSAEDKRVLSDAARFEMLKAQSASVNIVIDQSELYDWLIDGGYMVFNELNMSEANFLASFVNQLLDGTGFLFIPGRGDVLIHKDCVLFGTQNAGYVGVEEQNDATMSRFGCIQFPQPTSIKKQLIAATHAKLAKGDSPEASLPTEYFTQCQDFYKQCRSAVLKKLITPSCMNIRGFVRALVTVAESNGYTSLKRQIEIQVINTCPEDDRLTLNGLLQQVVRL